jgi:hypothetical protein
MSFRSAMRIPSVLGSALLGLALAVPLTAQSTPSSQPPAAPAVTQTAPPPKHALTPKERAKQQKQLEKELNPEDKKWLNEDVAYIITPEERQAFLQLQNEDEREAFIEEFWQRRNPDPTSSYNQYKEDYYQRFAYANQHYAAGIPGWGPIADASTSPGASPMKSTTTIPAAPMIGPRKKAAAPRRRTRLKIGPTTIWRAWAPTSSSSSSIAACAATSSSPPIQAPRTPC